MNYLKVKKLGALATFALLTSTVSAAVIDQILVRQDWPWSTKVEIEYKITGVTNPVDLKLTFYDGDTQLPSESLLPAITGDIYGIAAAGIGHLTLDPVKAFGVGKIVMENFKVKIEAEDSDPGSDAVLYKVFDLETGACTDVSRADLKNGKFGSYELLNGDLVWTEVTNRVEYMTTKLVLRRIKAKGETQRMGGALYNYNTLLYEYHYDMTMARDFYIGVFELTQGQWDMIYSSPKIANAFEGACRPREKVAYSEIRENVGSKMYPPDVDEDFMYPKAPKPKSFLGLLRAKTGAAFDLPSEAQWEFAARCGLGDGYWGTGVALTIAPGYMHSRDGAVPGLTTDSNPKLTPDGQGDQTAEVGRYRPNLWGLYDMHGNVYEWCLDWTQKIDGSYLPPSNAVELNGEANANGKYLADAAHASVEGGSRIIRGGAYNMNSEYSRFVSRNYINPISRESYIGFRVALPATDE